MLQDVAKDDSFDYYLLAQHTNGYSSSDLLSVCKAALGAPVREMRQAMKASSSSQRRHSPTPGDTSQPAPGGRAAVHLRPLSLWVRLPTHPILTTRTSFYLHNSMEFRSLQCYSNVLIINVYIYCRVMIL